jgi:hypothetical protein
MTAVTTVRRGVGAVGTVLQIVGTVVAGLLLLHIALTLLDANPANSLASFVRAFAATFGLGLGNLFTPSDPKIAVLLNTGAAAVIWIALTQIVVRLVRRAS